MTCSLFLFISYTVEKKTKSMNNWKGNVSYIYICNTHGTHFIYTIEYYLYSLLHYGYDNKS